jgi:hypothetical protein
MSRKKPVIFGALEHVHIPELGLRNVVAKVDTGAYTGALHCEGIRVVKQPDGTNVLTFHPISRSNPLYVANDYHRVAVTSASGHTTKRYVIPVTLEIQGQTYASYIGLTGRKGLKRQMLIGRRFLREHNITVDVTKNVEDDKSESF